MSGDDRDDRLLSRYQRVALRIWALFPADPLPPSEPAQTWVERMDALLDRQLLVAVTGVNWKRRAEMFEATVKRLCALDAAETAARMPPNSKLTDIPDRCAHEWQELDDPEGRPNLPVCKHCGKPDDLPQAHADAEAVWQAREFQRQVERAKRHEQGSDYWSRRMEEEWRRAEELKKEVESLRNMLRQKEELSAAQESLLADASVSAKGFEKEVERLMRVVRSANDRHESDERTIAALKAMSSGSAEAPEPLSPITCSACEQPIPMPKIGEKWETRDGSSRGIVGRVPSLYPSVPDGWGLIDGTRAGTTAMHLDAVQSGYWHRVEPPLPEPYTRSARMFAKVADSEKAQRERLEKALKKIAAADGCYCRRMSYRALCTCCTGNIEIATVALSGKDPE